MTPGDAYNALRGVRTLSPSTRDEIARLLSELLRRLTCERESRREEVSYWKQRALGCEGAIGDQYRWMGGPPPTSLLTRTPRGVKTLKSQVKKLETRLRWARQVLGYGRGWPFQMDGVDYAEECRSMDALLEEVRHG